MRRAAVTTRVSLVDTKGQRIINTIRIDDPFTGEDKFDIPFKVLTPGPYAFNKRTRKPTILRLRDYNGDGKALEFALFDKMSCSDLFTSLIGYNVRRDALLQYEVHVAYRDRDGTMSYFVTAWPEHLFNTKPVRPRQWHLSITYPPGPPDVPWEEWTVNYVPSREEFEAHCIATNTTTPLALRHHLLGRDLPLVERRHVGHADDAGDGQR